MRVLCFLLLAARANSLPQESETTTLPSPVDEAVAIDNDLLEALQQELIKNNITLTRDAEIPTDIAQVADLYDRVHSSLSPPQAERPSLRQGSSEIVAFGAGSIVSLAKLALVMIALNSGLREAAVVMGNGITGTLKLRQAAAPFGSTVITGTLSGLALKKGGSYGFHIHEFGNLTVDCTSAGVHYNPFMANHGGPPNSTRHVGDLGNIVSTADGSATVNITDSQVLLVGPTSVIGRAIVVHALKDDLGLGGNAASLLNGNAGLPIGCGVIGGA